MRNLRIFPMFLAPHAKSLTISRINGSTMRKKCCTLLLVFVLVCGAGCWAVVLVARMATCAPSRTIRGNCTQTFGAEFSFREQWRCLRLSLLTESFVVAGRGSVGAVHRRERGLGSIVQGSGAELFKIVVHRSWSTWRRSCCLSCLLGPSPLGSC